MEQNKAQFDLDRLPAKNSFISSGNGHKHEFLTGEDVFPEKVLLEKAATIKRFEYSPLGSELKRKSDITKRLGSRIIKDQTRLINLITRKVMKR